MYFLILPFAVVGLAAKIRNNKYKNKLNSRILELSKSNQKQLMRGTVQNDSPKQKAGFISKD